jgi:hypothetical protein
LPWLASNRDPPDLCLLSSWDSGHRATFLGVLARRLKRQVSVPKGYFSPPGTPQVPGRAPTRPCRSGHCDPPPLLACGPRVHTAALLLRPGPGAPGQTALRSATQTTRGPCSPEPRRLRHDVTPEVGGRMTPSTLPSPEAGRRWHASSNQTRSGRCVTARLTNERESCRYFRPTLSPVAGGGSARYIATAEEHWLRPRAAGHRRR